jgi:iron complex transport system substrate-binding protein
MKRPLFLGLAILSFIICYYFQSDDTLPKTTEESAPSPSCARLVSLAPSITETLFALGLGNNVVGVTRYCEYPEAATKISKVGGYITPSLTAIAALDPTLVIMLEEHIESLQDFDTLGIPSLIIATKSVDQIFSSIEKIGRICGVSSAADTLLDDLHTRMARIAAATKNKPHPKVLITMGRNMGTGGIKDVYIAGKENYYQDLIHMAGGINAYNGKVSFPIISREGMIGLDPQVIIDMVPDMEENGWTEKTILNEWNTIPVSAVKKGRVYILKENYIVIPGPRFILTLEAMARVLHPATKVRSM